MTRLITLIIATVTAVFSGKLNDAQKYYVNEIEQQIIEARMEIKNDKAYEGQDIKISYEITWLDEDTNITAIVIKVDNHVFEYDSMVDIDEDGEVDDSNDMCYIIDKNVYVSEKEFSEDYNQILKELGLEDLL